MSHARFSGFRFWKLSPIAFKCAVLELCVNDDALNLLHVLLSPHLKLNYWSDTSWDELRMFDMKTAQRRQRRCKRHALENTGATTANSLAPLRILDRPSGQHVPKRFTVQNGGLKGCNRVADHVDLLEVKGPAFRPRWRTATPELSGALPREQSVGISAVLPLGP